MEKEDALTVFQDHIRELEKEEEHDKERERRRRKQQERKNRDNFGVRIFKLFSNFVPNASNCCGLDVFGRTSPTRKINLNVSMERIISHYKYRHPIFCSPWSTW